MAFRERIFPTWVRLTSINRRAMRKNTDRGRLLQTGTFVCGAVGLDTDLSFAYQLFALLLCLLVFSRVSLRFLVPEINVRRHLPRYATAGEPFEYFVTVYNEGHRVERDLSITDNPRVVPPDFEQFQRMKEPFEETRNAYDRWIGFHRFVYLQKLNTGITVKNAAVPDIDIRARREATLEATPLRRGTVSFESITVLHPDPLGLNYGTLEFNHREQLTILPKRYPVSKQFEFTGGRHFQPGGVNSTWSIGESDEFVSLREYRDGDPIRKIHWASSAKREKPVVKEFQDEFFVRQALVIDAFSQDDERFEAVVSVAASLLTAIENQDGLIDLCYMGDKPEVITAGRGYAQTSQQLEALATLPVAATGGEQDFLQLLGDRARMMSGCLLVLSALDDFRQSLIDAVTARGVHSAVFVVTHDDDDTAYPPEVHVLHQSRLMEELASL